MPTKPRVLAFAGSLRRDSWNKKLVKIAAKGAHAAGAEVTDLDLKEVPLPVYDGDLEAAEGLPANAKKLKEIDRKSTRLNSSHSSISYAVFCLKKKNIIMLIELVG